MPWRKRGLIFEPPGTPEWMSSHAALPVTDSAPDGRITVYFCSRDPHGRSQIGRFEFDPARPGGAIDLSPQPCIRLGPLGAFDDAGVTSACLVNHGGRKYQYYSGWTMGVTVPFYFYIGLAVSEDGGRTFDRVSTAPVLGRDETDPYLTASPCVLVENGVWRMWYVSGVRWCMQGARARHYYNIRYAESSDGIAWGRKRPVCINFESPDEYAFGRPCVIRTSGGYRMWYCYRGEKYRIGYAESADGIVWSRHDDLAAIDVSPGEWDSDMLAYPWVFEHRTATYMLYNGNGYGKTGIGMAEWEGA